METIFAPYLFIPMMLESFGFSIIKFKVFLMGYFTSWTLYLYALPNLVLRGLAV